jgi:hypothetical protein
VKVPVIQKLERDRPPLTLRLERSDDIISVTEAELEHFVRHNNHRLLTAIDNSNIKTLGKSGKRLVVAVVDYTDQDAANKIISDLDTSISNVDIHHSHQYVFGHMDGVKWRKYLKKFGAYPPSILVLDMKNDGFYVEHSCDKNTIDDLVGMIISNEITTKMLPIDDANFIHSVKTKFKKYSPWSYIFVIFPCVFLLMSFLVPYPKDKIS